MLGDYAQIAVRDLGGRSVPCMSPEQAGGELSEHGRGLLGVSRLARAMGFCGSPAQGHTVWAQLDIRTAPEGAGAEKSSAQVTSLIIDHKLFAVMPLTPALFT
jgi:hypothetical protein